jgi:hypothetical protein
VDSDGGQASGTEEHGNRRYGVTVVTVLPTLFLVWGDRLEDGWLADAT